MATITGSSGNDSLVGGLEDDSISGLAGNDTLIGSGGNDTLDGGAGNDSITGDAGNDTILLQDGFGNDTVAGSTGNDVIDASALTVGVNLTYSSTFGNGSLTAGSNALNFTGVERFIFGSGNDTVNGSTPAELIDGGAGNDSLGSGAGADTVIGGAGNDTIVGGAGADLLDGGDGNDLFVLFTGDGGDTITGGNGVDTANMFLVSSAVTATFTTPGSGTITGTPGTYSFSGIEAFVSGLGNDSIVGSAGAESLVASNGNDTVQGNDGNDTLDGGSGTDQLFGGSGADRLIGGDGADILTGDAGDDTFVLAGGDSATGGAGDDVFTFDRTLPAGTTVTLVGGETGEDLTDPTNNPGGRVGDVLDLRGMVNVTVIPGLAEAGTAVFTNTGGLSITVQYSEIEVILTGDFTVDGTAGNDSMPSSFIDAQGDKIDGNDGVDDLINAAAGDDTVNAGLGSDTVDGGTGNDSLLGAAGNDSVLGGTGNDTLSGGTGNDILTGGDGDDRFILATGDGSDTLTGGEAAEGLGDLLDATAQTANVTLALTAAEAGTLISGSDTVSFSQIERIALGSGNDSVTGSTGNDSVDAGAGNDTLSGAAGNDTLSGGSGNDLLLGGAGADSLIGGAGTDTVSYATSAFGVAIDLATGTGAGGDAEGDRFSGIEGVIGSDLSDDIAGSGAAETLIGGLGDDALLAASGNDSVEGGAGDDYAEGGAGDDTVSGGDGNDLLYGDGINDSGRDLVIGDAGNDTLIGNALSDTLQGGVGNDLLYGGYLGQAGGDLLDGGAGIDTVSYEFSNVGVTVNLATGAGTGGDADGDTITGAEVVIGSDFDDLLAGGSGAETLIGGTGNDTLTGGAGDALSGGTGDDVFRFDRLAAGTAGLAVTGGANSTNGLGDVLSLQGLTSFTAAWTNGDKATGSGTLTYLNANGDLVTVTFSEIERIICFARGTLITTARGEVPVQDLQLGDLILTVDRGYQPLRWLAARHLTAEELARAPNLRPIRIRAGALGCGLPRRDLTVSPQHRILVRSKVAERMFASPEVLMAAKHMLELDGVETVEAAEAVEYWHLMCDRHEVILAEGAESETLFTGPEAMAALPRACHDELKRIFPDLATTTTGPAARPLPKGAACRQLVQRHIQNRKPMLSNPPAPASLPPAFAAE